MHPIGAVKVVDENFFSHLIRIASRIPLPSQTRLGEQQIFLEMCSRISR
jgi:hypothetical protein